ncbi:hypothetical protein [Caballeronia sp. SBC2]|uniref:hypothetical protein n=1 Tax=Caballeronia sp. SBC2 TaxID=2705547 RepID=UPI0013E0F7F0|nr:hypothetical protein [Caballeronia sp. SBC2]QIE22858.1 hypothetical protein SBC2_08710 [Caballeronia sp. SBC2]
MNQSFVELNRKFGVFEEDEAQELLVRHSYSASPSSNGRQFGWDELLGNRLVVILGEPGSGKSQELLAQHRRSSGSFLMPLEQLVDTNLAQVLSEGEAHRFERWRAGNGEAVFFLDAVDESKLKRDDDFALAIDRVSVAIGASITRARFVISSRISEWRPQTDREVVLQRLGIDSAPSNVSSLASDATSHVTRSQNTIKSVKHRSGTPIVIAVIQPLTASQVRLFAEAKGVRDATRFIEALDNSDAWVFAGRPLDVSHLYDYWRDNSKLSSLTDLTEFMVTKLLAEVANKEKLDPLSPERAREGAEYLAAAAILCRNLKFQIAEDAQFSDDVRLSPALILPEDWQPRERRALLDRALFDSASRGTLSFHHRSHTEYLAASWIERMMASNCDFEALKDVLTAELDGRPTLRGSLAPVAAWLVTTGAEPWRMRLADLILAIAPEIHLVHADPSALPLSYRRRVLAAIVKKYAERNHVSLNLNREALARLADETLAEDISGYLCDASVSGDLKVDLLVIVWEGKLEKCIDSALLLFSNSATSDTLRSYCVVAVRETGTAEHCRRLAQSFASMENISNATLGHLFETLFPRVLSAEEALLILRRAGNVERFSHDLQHTVGRHLKNSLNATDAVIFLRGFLSMLREQPLHKQKEISKGFDWVISFIPLCVDVCLQQKSINDADQNTVVEAVLVLEHALRHGSLDMYGSKDYIKPIRERLNHQCKVHQILFWRRVDILRLERNGNEPQLFQLNPHDGLAPWGIADVKWMLADIDSRNSIADRRLVMVAALQLLWTLKEPSLSMIWKLRRSLLDVELRPLICRNVRNRMVAPFALAWTKHVKYRLLQPSWWQSHARSVTSTYRVVRGRLWLWCHIYGLRAGKYPGALGYVVQAMQFDGANQYSLSDWSKVRAKWGRLLASSTQGGCINVWRTFTPLLPHEKRERNTVDQRAMLGLVALQTLWQSGRLNISNLSTDDVGRAIRYACNELNGFPQWFVQMADARADEAAQVLEEEVAAEFAFPASLEQVHEIVAKLAWTPITTAAATDALTKQLMVGDPKNPKVLEQAIAALLRAGAEISATLVSVAPSRLSTYAVAQQQWVTWMSTWMQLDALPALQNLQSTLRLQEESTADELVIRICSFLSNRRGEPQPAGRRSFLKPDALAVFIPLIHRHVRQPEDIDRANKGVYSPKPRDEAQDLRHRLWEALRSAETDDADTILQTFLTDPGLAAQRDWVLAILDERQSRRADPTAWAAQDIRAFARYFRYPPRSAYQLFRLTARLLLDIKGEIELSENATNRLEVREGDLEKHFQGFLHRKLSQRSMNWFSVTQESTVDLEQRPDLRIELPFLNALPVEVKLANLAHWSLGKLLERLENQLVGQYLRPAHVDYGIYVVGTTDPSRRWKSSDGRLIDFSEMVSILKSRATALVGARSNGVHGLEVVGIDFSDPRDRLKGANL